MPQGAGTAKRIFLLSPANSAGVRGRLVLAGDRLGLGVDTLGEAYSFISGLYFRGKLTYARAFADPPPGVPGVLVITPGRGLVPPDAPVTMQLLREMAAIPIDPADVRYREPLERHARTLAEAAGPDCDIILLGSVASAKYLDPLLAILGDRLLFPAEFVGRGDMSRGGLLLRCVRAGEQLAYAPARGAVLRGKRPPRLGRLPT